MDEATAKKLAADIVSLRYSEHRVAEILLTASRPAPGYLRASEGADGFVSIDRARRAIDDEPELPTRTPKEIEDAGRVVRFFKEQVETGNDDGVVFALRTLVKMTKDGIKERMFTPAAESAKGGHHA